MLSREAVNPSCTQTRHETTLFWGIFLVYQRNKWKHQFSVAPLPQEDVGSIWGYQVLRAWTTGCGKGKVASSFRYQVQRMRMRLLLPGNLGAAESVTLPGVILEAVMAPVLWWDTTSLTMRSHSRLKLPRIQFSRQHQESCFGSIRVLEEGVS